MIALSSLLLVLIDLTKPKSHILALQSLFKSILEGFKSLWTNYDEWRYLRALSAWIVIYLKCIYCNMLSEIAECKSASMISKIRYRSF